MEAQRCRVVLKGEIMEGYNPAEAIEALAALFGQPPEKLRGIFSGKAIPLKQELDLKRAQQLQARLHSLGVKCVLQPVEEPQSLTLSMVDHTAAPKAAPAYGVQMTCPKCGHQQDQAVECRNCGIVFSKWKELKLEQVEQKQQAGLNEDQLLHLFVDANGDKYLSKFHHFRLAQGYAFTWHWPALFVPVLWALYRKLWGWAAIMLVSLVVPFAFLIWPATANYIYFRHAKNQLARLGNYPNEANVAAAGGTSPKAVWVAIGVSVLLGFAGSSLLLKKVVDTENYYSHAAEQTKTLAPDTAEGRETVMVLRATGFMVGIWTATGKDVGTVSLENLATDLQQPPEQFQDGWGNPIRVSPTPDSFMVVSAGPDGAFGSEDDIRFEPPMRQ